MITIVVTHEDDQSDEFDFDPAQSDISIGRRSTNDVCIPNLSVSGRHARVVLSAGEAWIEDLNSTNGTYINNRLISRQKLNHNDELIIGKTRVKYKNLADDTTLGGAPSVHDQLADASADFSNDQLDISDHPAEVIAAEPIGREAEPVPAINPAAHRAVSSSEAMFESLADDLSDRATAQPASLLTGQPASPDSSVVASAPAADQSSAMTAAATHQVDAAQASASEARNNADDDAPLSLSDKAKLALGRTAAPRPKLAAVNGSAALAPEVDHSTAQPQQSPKRVVADASPTPQPNTRPAVKPHGAAIEIKNGAKSGQILPIDKPVTTLGRPGIQIAAIMRKPDGYFLMHIESDDSVDRPTLNQDAIGDEPMLLHSGDELNVAGIDVEFMLS